MAPARRGAGVDKRRLILDAAIRVFARQGFHSCRVSDVADDAGVAYGLVYHYFDSKEEILGTLFRERWRLMLDEIAAIDACSDLSARDKLYRVASFIIDSYRLRARPDEGDHRRGDSRGELIRSPAPRRDPGGLPR